MTESLTIRKEYTKEYIQNKIMTDDRWLIESLLSVYRFQTESEQKSRHTNQNNGRGFTQADSPYLSYISQWVLSGKPLNDKHKEKTRKRMVKYWKQIQVLIIHKQQTLQK